MSDFEIKCRRCGTVNSPEDRSGSICYFCGRNPTSPPTKVDVKYTRHKYRLRQRRSVWGELIDSYYR